jgi:hypothetical protein
MASQDETGAKTNVTIPKKFVPFPAANGQAFSCQLCPSQNFKIFLPRPFQ